MRLYDQYSDVHVCAYVCVWAWCSAIICCVYTFCVTFPELCFPAHVGVNFKFSSDGMTIFSQRFIHLCCLIFFYFFFSLSLVFVSICMSQPFPLRRFVQAPVTDCPPSQSLRRHSRETRHAQAGCLYHVYLCSSRVSFLPSFHLLPPFIACNISSGLTG